MPLSYCLHFVNRCLGGVFVDLPSAFAQPLAVRAGQDKQGRDVIQVTQEAVGVQLQTCAVEASNYSLQVMIPYS